MTVRYQWIATAGQPVIYPVDPALVIDRGTVAHERLDGAFIKVNAILVGQAPEVVGTMRPWVSLWPRGQEDREPIVRQLKLLREAGG